MLRAPALIACWMALAATAAGVGMFYVNEDSGTNEIVQLLADRGARLDAVNRNGFTPLQVANGEEFTSAGLQRRPETVALLRELLAARGLPAVIGSDAPPAGR